MTTDLTTVDEAAVAEIVAGQEDEFDASLLQTPLLKIGQPLSREVESEAAEAGEFINSLTGEGLGNQVGFIVAYYNKGRFAVDKDSNRAFVAFDAAIPEQWSELVGDEFVGTPFAEYPDAEETYKDRVNRKEIEWGSGPLISTTHNFTGFVIVSAPEGSDEEDELQPVRLSLKRIDMPSVRKILTLKRASLRNKPFWDRVFDFSTEKKTFSRGSAFILNPKLGRPTTAEEKAQAVDLAQAVRAGRVVSNENPSDDKPVEPDAQGGLKV